MMRVLLLLFILITPLAALAERPIIVELFTSHGCSSCPPADRFLHKLVEENKARGGGEREVLPLSFHVDYWNHLGWKDPFSSRENTNRQRAYGLVLGARGLYTPQIVVDGAAETVGSRKNTVRRMIARAAEVGQDVPVRLVFDGENRLKITVGKEGALSEPRADIWLVTYDSEKITRIVRGENAGKTLVNRNVVNGTYHLGEWQQGLHEATLKLGALPKAEFLLVLVQARVGKEGIGKVLGVDKIAW